MNYVTCLILEALEASEPPERGPGIGAHAPDGKRLGYEIHLELTGAERSRLEEMAGAEVETLFSKLKFILLL